MHFSKEKMAQSLNEVLGEAYYLGHTAIQTAIPYVVAGANAVANTANNLKSEGTKVTNASNAIELVKGEEINLTKAAAGITKFVARLSWAPGTDLDVSAIPLDSKGKLAMPIVYYGNLSAPGITHSGDLRNGGVEEITFETDKFQAPAAIVAVTSHSQNDDGSRGTPVKFGAAAQPKAELINPATGEVLVVVNLKTDAGLSTSVEFVELYRNDKGDFMFKALTNPVGNDAFGLADIIAKYKA